MPKKPIPKPVPQKWIRNKADQQAIENGCWFDIERGKFAVEWIETNCIICEGVPEPVQMKLFPFWKDAIMRIFSWVRWDSDRELIVRRFRKAVVFIGKKNAKTPTLAAVGTYMLCGEKGYGRRCFNAARDAKQALLAQTHAMRMVQHSPTLSTACTVTQEKTNGLIEYTPTQSTFRILAGDNEKSQEGLNADYVGIDEAHVVSEQLADVLEYASISRAEPLHLCVSTAGNNIESWGYKQFDYGRRVNDGSAKDDSFFYLEYSTPMNVTDEELDADIVKYGMDANPAWGLSVFKDEFISSWNRDKQSPHTLARFKMYRLNQWQNSSNPAIPRDAWNACYDPKPFESSEIDPDSKPVAFGGLDLSKVSDMSAFVLSVPQDDGRILLMPRMWMTEAYAKANRFKAEFLTWAEKGYLKLTPGNSMDHNFIMQEVYDLSKRYAIQNIAYDPMFGDTLVKQIRDGVYNPSTGEIMFEGIGCDVTEFPQTAATYNAPCLEFLAYIHNRTIIHDNNPCFNWSIGNVEFKSDSLDYIRPVKPHNASGEDETVKKIDVAIASIMSVALSTRHINEMKQGNGGIFVL